MAESQVKLWSARFYDFVNSQPICLSANGQQSAGYGYCSRRDSIRAFWVHSGLHLLTPPHVSSEFTPKSHVCEIILCWPDQVMSPLSLPDNTVCKAQWSHRGGNMRHGLYHLHQEGLAVTRAWVQTAAVETSTHVVVATVALCRLWSTITFFFNKSE